MTIENFYKMNGLGNDFVIFDKRGGQEIKHIVNQVRRICDRNLGIGCDQMIIITDSEKADARMMIYNMDGSQSGACGNATRCVAKLIDLPRAHIEIGGRTLEVQREQNDFKVNMGPADFKEEVVVAGYKFYLLDIGNPHAVTFDEVPNQRELGELMQDRIKGGVNVNFATVLDSSTIKLKVFERGVGFTMACGSGACATYAIAERLGHVSGATKVCLKGGDLEISKLHLDIVQKGGAEINFTGSFSLFGDKKL